MGYFETSNYPCDETSVTKLVFSPLNYQDLYVIDSDQNKLTHYKYDNGRFVVSQVRSSLILFFSFAFPSSSALLLSYHFVVVKIRNIPVESSTRGGLFPFPLFFILFRYSLYAMLIFSAQSNT